MFACRGFSVNFEECPSVVYRLPMPSPAGAVVVYFPLQFWRGASEVGFARFFLCPRIMQNATAQERMVAEIYRMNEGLSKNE